MTSIWILFFVSGLVKASPHSHEIIDLEGNISLMYRLLLCRKLSQITTLLLSRWQSTGNYRFYRGRRVRECKSVRGYWRHQHRWCLQQSWQSTHSKVSMAHLFNHMSISLHTFTQQVGIYLVDSTYLGKFYKTRLHFKWSSTHSTGGGKGRVPLFQIQTSCSKPYPQM